MKKKKPKIQYHKTCFHSLQYEVVTIYKEGASIGEIIQEATKDFPEIAFVTDEQSSSAGAITILPQNSRSVYVVFNGDVTYDIVAHECIHITSFSFYLIQSVHNEHTEEIYAYNFQSVYNTICDILVEEFKIDKENFYCIKKEEDLKLEDDK